MPHKASLHPLSPPFPSPFPPLNHLALLAFPVYILLETFVSVNRERKSVRGSTTKIVRMIKQNSKGNATYIPSLISLFSTLEITLLLLLLLLHHLLFNNDNNNNNPGERNVRFDFEARSPIQFATP